MNRTVMITGGAGGLGLAIAKKFAALGDKPALIDVDAKRLAAAEKEIGGGAKGWRCDITDYGQVEKTVGEIERSLGPVELLVNCAGIVNTDRLWEMPVETWKRTIDINLNGAFYCLREVARRMISRGKGGKVVNIASLAGRNGGIMVSPAYSTSKTGLVGLTMAAAKQLARHKINVNCVAPGSLESEMVRSFGAEKHDALKDSVPWGRLGVYEDIAPAVVYLCSPEADYVTGVTLDVNGGLFMSA